MIHKPLDAVTATDLQSLVDNGVKEQRTIEYKQQLPGSSDGEKKEFLADVSSFANAGGGDLIYGVVAKDGIPESIPGLADFIEDKERLRLESTLRDGLDPRIPGIHLEAIQGFPNGPVLVLRVPRSWAGPHMVTFKGSSRFFSRSSAGKFQMDVTELRFAFETAGDLPVRIRRWRDERLGRIVAGDGPILLASSAYLVLHLIPLGSFADHWRFDVKSLGANIVNLPPLGSRGWNNRYNVDGLLTFHPNGGKPDHAFSYAQLFRSGRVEALDGFLIGESNGERGFYAQEAEKSVLTGTEKYLSALNSLGVEPPIVFLLSVLGAKGVYIAVSSGHSMRTQHSIDRDVLLLPDVLIEEYACDLAQALRPSFDAMWNACGYAGSPSYGPTGN